MQDRRAVLVLVLVVALIGAGFWYSRSSSTISRDDEAAPTTSTSTTSSTTTVVLAEDGTPIASGDLSDWQAGLTKLTAVENDLFENPDSTRVGEIMKPECSCYQATIDNLTSLKAAGLHVAGDTIVVKSSTFVDQKGRTVDVLVNAQPAGFPTVDSSGKSVGSSPANNPLPFLYVIEKSDSGAWRIVSRDVSESIK